MERSKLVFVFSLIILVLAFIYLLSPVLDGILMGIALAYAVRPLHLKLRERVGERVSAFLSTMVVSLPIFFFFAYGVFQGVTEFVIVLKDLEDYVNVLNTYLNNLDPEISKVVRPVLSRFADTLISIFNTKIGDLAFNITTKFIFFVMNFLISVVVCFYVIIDGKVVAKKIVDLVFPGKDVDEFFEEFDGVLTNLWHGNFLFALVMGIVSIPYFKVFGLSYVPLLSGLMFLAALIPVFAEWMVILPLTIYLFFVDWAKAVWFFAVGCVFLYIIPELILRPYFVGYASKIHPLVLMLSFLGGGLAAGVTGFFISPMIAAFLTAVYNHYTKQAGKSVAS